MTITKNTGTKLSVVVIGLGAMGGGMARALLDSEMTGRMVGYDINQPALDAFFQEAKAAGKVGGNENPPNSLRDAILDHDVNIVVLSLVNESQCETVCFGGVGNGHNSADCLLQLMPKGSCVILTSTVTATWANLAGKRFQDNGIFFVDCPVSGGPKRARDGDLTAMASGNAASLEQAKSILETLARDIYIIEGGAGAGSMVKCVHQLLAGVHICVAAEALSMGAKAGLNVDQLYQIVNGAAGASWMFKDRGERILSTNPEVKSALDIFVKDLGIVFEEAKKIQCPIPVASAALQQFISGQSLGLGRMDDSQVVKVYENVTRVPVVGTATDGPASSQQQLVLSNSFLKVYKADNRASFTVTCNIDSFGNLNINLKGIQIVVEVIRALPKIGETQPFHDENLDCVGSYDKFIVYKNIIKARTSITTSHHFYHLVVNLSSCNIKLSTPGGSSWVKIVEREEIEFKEPGGIVEETNLSDSTLERLVIRLS